MTLVINGMESFRRRNIVIVSTIVTLSVCSLSGCGRNYEKELSSSDIKTANSLDRTGVYSARDYERLLTIAASIRETKQVNNDDLDFMLEVLDKPSTNRCEVVETVYSYLRPVSGLTADQKARVYKSLVKNLKNPGDDSLGTETCSILNTLGKLGRIDSLSMITPYASSANDEVRFCASRAIHRITSRTEIWN